VSKPPPRRPAPSVSPQCDTRPHLTCRARLLLVRGARSGLRAMGEELSERALACVCRSLDCVGLPHWPLPPLFLDVAGPAVGGEAADRPDPR